MKKNTSRLLCLMLSSAFLLPGMMKAQDFSKELMKGNFFRNSWHDESGNKIDVTKFYKGTTNEVERIDSVIEFKDGSRFESKVHFVAGDTNLIFQYYYDAQKQLRYERTKDFDINGKLESDNTRWLSPRGNENKTRAYDPSDKIYKIKTLKDGKWVETSEPAVTETPQKDSYTISRLSNFGNRNSTPKLELTAGYSYLRAGTSATGLGLPLGFELSATYNLNRKLGVLLDASYHSGEKNDQQYDREYAMAGIQYECNDCCCDDDPIIFTRVLIGYGREGYKFMNFKNSNSGLITSVGAGVNFRINPKTFIQLKTDAISTFFNDDMQIDYRVGLGVGLNLGNRPSSLRKNPNINLKRF